MDNFAGECEGRYSERAEWKDVTPIFHSDPENEVVRIGYSDEFAEAFAYLRAVIVSGERSERAFQLTTHCARLNPANYTVWMFRRDLLHHLNKDLSRELTFVSQVIEDNPKNYQVWHHRKVLVDKLKDSSCELKFTDAILADDSKNYHAWQHRQWVVETFGLWGAPDTEASQLAYSLKMLADDVRNNSAWNYRFFVISSTTGFTPAVIEDELRVTLELVAKAPHNESGWNYLSGILMEAKDGHRLVPDDANAVWRFCRALYDDPKRRSPQLIAFMADALGDNLKFDSAVKLYEELVTADPIRERYWLHQKRTLENAKQTA